MNEIAIMPHTVTPMDLICRAQQANASIDQMQQLFELQLRYEANEGRKAYNEAMANFRKDAPAIARTRVGHNIKYAGLSESIEAVQPLLSEFGLSHQWKTRQDGNLITVECTVSHRMGHSESTSLSSAPDTSGSKNAIQAIGSTVSYLERYTLFAILGLSSREMDDNGKGANKKTEEKVVEIDDDETANMLDACATLDELSEAWKSIPVGNRKFYVGVKDSVKYRLQGQAEVANG